MLSRLSRGFKYLLGSPDYVFYYFAGKLPAVLTATTGATDNRLAELREELANAPEFARRIRDRRRAIAGEEFELDQDHHFLYALVRLLRPRVILETGVFDGFFSACYLQALAENERRHGVDGKLISIDLPAHEEIEASTSRHKGRTTLPRDQAPGWVIPDHLRSRWQCHLGDSRTLLPQLLGQLTDVDLFFHDSLHTYDHMMFEYQTVWPKLQPDSVLLSHDVHWNRAFPDFARRQGRKTQVAHGFGLIRRG